MNILLIGSGGREHALAWKISQSPMLDKLFAIPGNPGIKALAECITDISTGDNAAIVRFAQEKKAELVVVGPEAPLTSGLVDDLAAAGIKAFGPTKKAAALEGSKSFAKNIMEKYGIPTAKYRVFSEAAAAKDYIRQEGAPIVIKADGLAAGKGVIVAMTQEEALAAIDTIMVSDAFGGAGNQVVIEEFMEGEEASLLAFTDGETIKAMVSSQDHKRAYDGDQGPNTGGMGTYAPAPVMTPEVRQKAEETILRPIIAAMKEEGIPYSGCLYAGLMIKSGVPKVVEFNARFGDPETQVILPLLKSDLVPIMLACADGTLADQTIEWLDEAAVCVILASGGYPASYEKGFPITGLENANDALIFHAGTAEKCGQLITAGGRVLGMTAVAGSIAAARQKAYDQVSKVHFANMHYRKDIANRGLRR